MYFLALVAYNEMQNARQGLITCKGFFLSKCSLSVCPEAPACPFTQHSQVPVDGSTALEQINSPPPHQDSQAWCHPNTTRVNFAVFFRSHLTGCTLGWLFWVAGAWYDSLGLGFLGGFLVDCFGVWFLRVLWGGNLVCVCFL